MSLSPAQTILSTSTYTVTGTATVSAQQLSLIVITNTSTTTTPSLSTSTVGPFTAGGFIGTATINVGSQFALNTTAGTAGQGGYLVPQGAVIYIVSGTDATAASSFVIDYQIQAGSAVTI